MQYQREDTTIYQVVVNHEEQYSIWPADREVPLGWEPVGKTGSKDEVLAYIKEIWTDMRPLSLRKKMEEMSRGDSGEKGAAPMAMAEHEDFILYQVIVNQEEQYSIWPADREVPLGWRHVGIAGTREQCLASIEEIWTDMRPLSLRRKMEEM